MSTGGLGDLTITPDPWVPEDVMILRTNERDHYYWIDPDGRLEPIDNDELVELQSDIIEKMRAMIHRLQGAVAKLDVAMAGEYGVAQVSELRPDTAEWLGLQVTDVPTSAYEALPEATS